MNCFRRNVFTYASGDARGQEVEKCTGNVIANCEKVRHFDVGNIKF